MSVIRHERVYVVREKSIKELGIEKALIFDNLLCVDEISRVVGLKEDLHLRFPIFEKKKFYRLLNQLIKDGLVEESND